MVATRRSRKASKPEEMPPEDIREEHRTDASQSDDDEAPEEVTLHKSKTVRVSGFWFLCVDMCAL